MTGGDTPPAGGPEPPTEPGAASGGRGRLLVAGLALVAIGVVAGAGAGVFVALKLATPARPTPTPSPSFAVATGPDLTPLAERCQSVPSGTLATYLQPATLIHGTEPDPRTHASLPVVRSTFDAEIPPERPSFSITAVIQAPGQGSGAGGTPIDRMGSLQLWVFWDGSQAHKGVRRWNGKAWTMATDDAAPSLTIELQKHSVAFHSADIQGGSTFAFVTADAGGCGALGLDADGRPATGF
jgi:hypothetical protein